MCSYSDKKLDSRNLNNNPLFSIITVTYNCEDVLENTIKSIINQKFNDYEYIIVDGNSSDRTIEVIKKYDSNISFWQSEPDKGIYDAMNKGIKLAKGKWIFFLNAGDVFIDDMVLNSVYEKIEKSDSDILYGVAIDNNGLAKYHPYRITKKMFLTEKMICHQTIFAKIECFNNNLFNTDYKIISDRIWLYNCYKNKKIKSFNKIISIYDNNGVSSNQEKFDKESLEFVKSISKFWFVYCKLKRIIRFRKK